jgi:hypothetical protein
VTVQRLNWHRSAIFQRQYDFSSATGTNCLCAPARGTEGNRSAPTCHWKVAGRVERRDVLPDMGPWGLQDKDAQ